MQIINARLRHRSELFSLHITEGCFSKIETQENTLSPTEKMIDAKGQLICAPFV